MARNGSGTYNLPSATNPVVTNTVISSIWANGTMSDIGNELTNSLPRDGQAGMNAALKLIDGTVTTPGITFSAESATGLYRPGTSQIALTVSGTQQLLATTSGIVVPNVLSVTGNASVGGTLGVTGVTTLTGALVANGTVTANSTVTHSGNTSLNGLTIATIGTDSSTYREGIRLEGNGASTGSVSSALTFSGANVNAALWSVRYPSYGGDLILATQTTGGGTPTEKMRVTQNGLVGISVTPTAKFDVVIGASTRYQLNEAGGNVYQDYLNTAASAWSHSISRSTQFDWFTNTSGAPTAGMTLDGNGNIGVGVTPAGTWKIQTPGSITAANYGIGTNLTTDAGTFGLYNGNGPAISMYGQAAGGSANVMLFYRGNSGSSIENARFDASGNFGIGNAPSGSAKLEITSSGPASAIFRTTTASSYTSVRLYNDINSNVRALEIDYTGSTYAGGEQGMINTTGAYPFSVGTSNLLRTQWDTSGNLNMNTAAGTAIGPYSTMLCPTPASVGTTLTKVAAFGTNGTSSVAYPGQWRWYHSEGNGANVNYGGYKLVLRAYDSNAGESGNIVSITPSKFDLGAGSGSLTINGGITRAELVYGNPPAGSGTPSASHGGPRKPDIVRTVLRCLTAEQGYSVGDEVDVVGYGSGNNYAQNFANATTVGCVYTRTGTWLLLNKGTQTLSAITTANWNVVFYCIWL